MFRIIFPLAITASVLLNSCSSPSQDSNASSEETKIVFKQHKISLNNGQRWEANPETTEGVYAMKQLLAEFTPTDSLKDYSSLKGQLQEEFTMIFQKCTMKGEAHNQLHNFLIPIKNNLEQMDKTDIADSKVIFQKLKNHMEIYDEFFI